VERKDSFRTRREGGGKKKDGICTKKKGPNRLCYIKVVMSFEKREVVENPVHPKSPEEPLQRCGY